jgi:hypothetical protein
MADLKLYLDRVTNAQANVQSILNQIDAAMQLNTPEGAEQALALESQLDEAIANRDKDEKFYNKIVNAMKTTDLLKNFVPVSDTPTTTSEEEQPQGVMKLSEFQNLSPRERLAFAKAGGKLEEEGE